MHLLPLLLRSALAGGLALAQVDALAANATVREDGGAPEDAVKGSTADATKGSTADAARSSTADATTGSTADATTGSTADATTSSTADAAVDADDDATLGDDATPTKGRVSSTRPVPAEGPTAPETIRVRPPAPVLDEATLDRQRKAAIGLLVAAGLADLAAFALRGADYYVLSQRCAEDPTTGELPADTRCPNLLALNVLGGAHTPANVGLYALAIEGGKGLGRQRADRARAGLAPAHDHARAQRVIVPLAYFTTVGAAVFGALVFFDNITSPAPGTKLRAPPVHTPPFDPLLQFGTQAAMTVSAAFIAAAMRSRSYRLRTDEFEVSAAFGPTPGGASFGVLGRF